MKPQCLICFLFNFKFLMIFRKAKNGELKVDSGLQQLFSQIMEIDVGKEGVKGAKTFFEAQVSVLFRFEYLLKFRVYASFRRLLTNIDFKRIFLF